jgi:hypothetical protein
MIGTQGVSLWHFHVCVQCTLVWFIPSNSSSSSPSSPFLKWLRQVLISVSYSYMCRKHPKHIYPSLPPPPFSPLPLTWPFYLPALQCFSVCSLRKILFKNQFSWGIVSYKNNSTCLIWSLNICICLQYYHHNWNNKHIHQREGFFLGGTMLGIEPLVSCILSLMHARQMFYHWATTRALEERSFWNLFAKMAKWPPCDVVGKVVSYHSFRVYTSLQVLVA